MKRFVEWIRLKQKLHQRYRVPPMVAEGQLWWASLGENIGHEMNGSNAKFSRPVVVVKKLSKELLFVVPVTTRPHDGKWFVYFRHRRVLQVACLHQVRIIDYRRLDAHMGQIHSSDFTRIKTKLRKLYDL